MEGLTEQILIVSRSDLRDLMRTEFLAAVEERAAQMIEHKTNENTLINTREVMEMTGYKRRTINDKIREKALKPVSKENRCLMFNKQDVLDAIAVGKLKKRGGN